MSRAATTIRWFAIYLGGLGLLLVLTPNFLLSTFAMPETHEPWIRVLGVVVFNLGVYYWYAAISEARPFFKATVATRTIVVVSFIAFVLLGLAPPMLLLFGTIDFVAGLWTAWAVREDRRASIAPAAA